MTAANKTERPAPGKLAGEIKSSVSRFLVSEPLSHHSTFGIGGPADYYAEVKNIEELKIVLAFARKHKLPLFPIGNGSNLLISDKGWRGVVLRLKGEFQDIEFNDTEVWAGAGAAFPILAKQCAERGLAGAEPLAGIPGTVGGGLMTNAGTAEGDLGSLVQEVWVADESGRIKSVPKKDIRFSYRRSNLTGRLVVRARLQLRRGDKNDIMARIERSLEKRAQTQPIGTYNVGSIFKNPPGDFAARLIQAAHLKGYRVGGAEISQRHANFIVNKGPATAEDVQKLIAHVQKTVYDQFSVKLELEIWPVGQ
jgi:UDP-N-acetylmuramate dehydrogenase